MKTVKQLAFVAASLALFATACTKEESLGLSSSVEVGSESFVLATQVTSASTGDTTMVLLTAESLESGSLSVIGVGTELESLATEWSKTPDNKYFFSIKDNGGSDPTDVVQYYLNASTGRMEIKRQYVGDAYHTWGMWGEKFATTRNGTYSDSDDAKYSYTIDDSSNQAGTYYAARTTTSYSDPSTGATELSSYDTNNYIGKYVSEYSNGETATVVGFVTAGDYVYASYATTGVTQFAIGTAGYGWDSANSKYVAQGWGSYTNTIDVANSFTATGGVPFPLTPGNTYIARYPVSGSFESTPTFITTEDMGQAFGRTTGNPLNTVVANEDDEYVYIFSPGTTRRYSTDLSTEDDAEADQYSESESTDRNDTNKLSDKLYVKTSNKGARVMRIKYGATTFDSSFGTDGYLDFNSSLGNYTFSRVWHIAGSKFLLRVIHTENLYNASHKTDVGDAYFYIFDTDSNTAVKVSGLPEPEDFVDQGSRAIGEPHIEGTKAYVPMATNTATYPAIWVIDTTTASATKGLEVQSTSIVSVGKLIAQ
ncbi:MAG: DUF4374 domain-containing protein [Rikenellaceae bacterium]